MLRIRQDYIRPLDPKEIREKMDLLRRHCGKKRRPGYRVIAHTEAVMLGEKRYAKPACNELAIEIEGLDGYRVNKRDCKNVERDMLDIILPELIKNRSLEAAKNWVDAIYCLSGYK